MRRVICPLLWICGDRCRGNRIRCIDGIIANLRFLVMGLTWLFFPQIPLAVVPFAVYSTFHALHYTAKHLIPVISPPAADGTLVTYMLNVIQNLFDFAMAAVCFVEIGLWFYILGSV